MSKMELDWSHNEERQRGTLRYSFGMDNQKEGEDQVDQKQHGGEWLRMKDERQVAVMSDCHSPSRKIVVDGRRMPYVPYGMERHVDIDIA